MRKVILLLVAVGCVGFLNAQTITDVKVEYQKKEYGNGDTIYYVGAHYNMTMWLHYEFKNGSKPLKGTVRDEHGEIVTPGDTIIIKGSLTGNTFTSVFVLEEGEDIAPTETFVLHDPAAVNISNNTRELNETTRRGSADAECSYTSADGAVNLSKKMVYFYLINVTSVSEASLAKVKVFPSLASDEVQVINLNNSNVAIYSLVGQQMIAQSNLTGNVSIDVSSLVNGIYFVKIQNGSAIRTEKIKIVR